MRLLGGIAAAGLLGLAGAALAIAQPSRSSSPTAATITAPIATTEGGATVGATTVTATASGPTGLTGYVRLYPAAPTCPSDGSCTRPAKVILLFRHPGHSITTGVRAMTHSTGFYRVLLPAGLYSVSLTGRAMPLSTQLATRLRPSLVRVLPHRVLHVDFLLQTGIY